MGSIHLRASTRFALAGLFGLSWSFAASPGSADTTEIGAVRDVVAVAYGTPPGGERGELWLLEPVVTDQRLETAAPGGLHVRFLDETDLWLDAESDVVLDAVVYDPAKGTGEFVLELGPGLFRIVTGLMPKESYSIRTPAAIIGVRGTDFAVAVAESGATRVTVYSGEVTLAPRGGGSATPVAQAETASVADANATVSVSSTAAQVDPPALSVDATADTSVSVDSLSVDALSVDSVSDSAVSDAAAAASTTGDIGTSAAASDSSSANADSSTGAADANSGGKASNASATSVSGEAAAASAGGATSDGASSTGDGGSAGGAGGSSGGGGGSGGGGSAQ